VQTNILSFNLLIKLIPFHKQDMLGKIVGCDFAVWGSRLGLLVVGAVLLAVALSTLSCSESDAPFDRIETTVSHQSQQ
jgi:hypothetical protein